MSVEDPYTDGGTIDIEDKKFQYRLLTNPVQELVIYEREQVQPLVTCSFMKDDKGQNPLSFQNKETIHEYASLLLGLCWYLYNPAFSDNNVDQPRALSMA